jgi:hypothetical protein
MSYIDPDLLHGALTDVSTFITNNAAAITAKGVVNPAALATTATAIQTNLSGTKGIRDQKKTEHSVAQQNYVASAAENYTDFSDLIDTLAGAVGKQTPAGIQVLGYRTHVTGGSHHAKPAAAPTATPAK